LREERDGSWLGPLITFALVVGVILLLLSLVAGILHFLFVVAIVWLVCSIALGAYRAGRRRGP
jgi:membrane protein required for beta-lactamase induction